MDLRSRGYHADLLFHRFRGEIADCGDDLVIRTPGNPRYCWGNG
jgi:hypothetical protein